jgi:hypothetical protein
MGPAAEQELPPNRGNARVLGPKGVAAGNTHAGECASLHRPLFSRTALDLETQRPFHSPSASSDPVEPHTDGESPRAEEEQPILSRVRPPELRFHSAAPHSSAGGKRPVPILMNECEDTTAFAPPTV